MNSEKINIETKCWEYWKRDQSVRYCMKLRWAKGLQQQQWKTGDWRGVSSLTIRATWEKTLLMPAFSPWVYSFALTWNYGTAMPMFFFNVQFFKNFDILALLLLALCALIILTPFSFRDLNWEQCPKAWILDAWSLQRITCTNHCSCSCSLHIPKWTQSTIQLYYGISLKPWRQILPMQSNYNIGI